jgi:hypothetical protein
MKRCENQGKTAETRCDNKAEQGHIYCTKCRLHSGGYNRYNPSAVASRTQNSSNKQE